MKKRVVIYSFLIILFSLAVVSALSLSSLGNLFVKGNTNLNGSLIVNLVNVTGINDIYYVQKGNSSDIQAKVNLCNSNCHVIVPEGTYTNLTNLVLPSNIYLDLGKANFIRNSNEINKAMIYVNNKSNVRISGGIFDGSNILSTQDNQSGIIMFSGVANFIIENVEIKNASGRGLYIINYSNNGNINNINSEAFLHPIAIANGQRINLNNIILSGSKDEYAAVISCIQCNLNNFYSRNNKYGVEIAYDAEKVNVVNYVSYNDTYGFTLRTGRQISLSNYLGIENTKSIFAPDWACNETKEDININNFQIYNVTTGNAIELWNCNMSNVIISNGIIDNVALSGIRTINNSQILTSGNVLINNVVFSNLNRNDDSFAYGIRSTSPNTIVQNSKFTLNNNSVRNAISFDTTYSGSKEFNNEFLNATFTQGFYDTSTGYNGSNFYTGFQYFNSSKFVIQGGEDAQALMLLSGASTKFIGFIIGRTVREGSIAVADSNNVFATRAVAGDIIIRTESQTNKLIFSSISVPMVLITNSSVNFTKIVNIENASAWNNYGVCYRLGGSLGHCVNATNATGACACVAN